jgi:hypothetical protein
MLIALLGGVGYAWTVPMAWWARNMPTAVLVRIWPLCADSSTSGLIFGDECDRRARRGDMSLWNRRALVRTAARVFEDRTDATVTAHARNYLLWSECCVNEAHPVLKRMLEAGGPDAFDAAMVLRHREAAGELWDLAVSAAVEGVASGKMGNWAAHPWGMLTEFVGQGVDGAAIGAVIRLAKGQTEDTSANRSDKMFSIWALGKMRPCSDGVVREFMALVADNRVFARDDAFMALAAQDRVFDRLGSLIAQEIRARTGGIVYAPMHAALLLGPDSKGADEVVAALRERGPESFPGHELLKRAVIAKLTGKSDEMAEELIAGCGGDEMTSNMAAACLKALLPRPEVVVRAMTRLIYKGNRPDLGLDVLEAYGASARQAEGDVARVVKSTTTASVMWGACGVVRAFAPASQATVDALKSRLDDDDPEIRNSAWRTLRAIGAETRRGPDSRRP